MGSGVQIVLRLKNAKGEPGDAVLGIPPAGEVRLSLPSRTWASDIVGNGIAGLPRGDGAVQRVVVTAGGGIPTLDEMLAASLVAWILEEGKPPEGAEPLARYAGLARAGFSPSKVDAEYSIAGIYQALTWPFGTHLADAAAGTGGAEKFVAQWQRMAGVLRQAMRAGKDPFTEKLFSESQGFAQEIISLRSDRQVYGQDVKAGMQFRIQLGAGSAGEVVNSALILRKPKSLLFKEWAHGDVHSPTGDGYLILGVEWDEGDWIFSTDPVQRISLKPLAEALDAREREKGGTAVWFDGAVFGHSLIAAPKSGSRLAPTDVLAVFGKWARARHEAAGSRGAVPRSGPSGWRWQVAAACALVLAGLAWWGFARTARELPADPSAAATELDELHVRTLKSRGTANSANLALFVGINEFRNGEFPQLTFAVDDAIAQAHLFAMELDLMDPKNVILAIQGVPGTRRGATQLKELVAQGVTVTPAFKSDILGGLMKLNGISQQGESGGLLVVSMSTHGLELPGGAYVIPHDGLRQTPDQDIAVDALDTLMNRSRTSKHLLIVDACREVPKGDSRDVPPAMPVGFLQALAAAKGQKVMASCSAGQLSYEVPAKGHGIFTYWMLMGLKGQAGADGRGMITVGTMEAYLGKKVADYSAHNAPGVQVPWFSADDGSQDIPLALPAEP